MKTKNIMFLAFLVLLAGVASCTKDQDVPTGIVFNANDIDLDIIGTWGVEKIVHYDIDYAGNPIASTFSSHEYDPNDIENGKQIVFREENTGEMYNITDFDSTFVYLFVYSYINDTLFLNIDYGTEMSTYSCLIIEKTNDSFTWENNFSDNHMEKIYFKRLSQEPSAPSNGFVIRVSTNPINGGTVAGGGTYQQGQSCTVTVMANEGYTFVNWTEGGTQVSSDANYTFTVTSNRTLVANFSVCDYSDILLNEVNGDTKFIEIYNKGDMDLSLEGMFLMKDDYVAGAIWTADATIVAPAHDYVVLYSIDTQADHPELGENMFFNSGISSKKTIRITLFMPDGTERDVFSRGTTGEWGVTVSNVDPQSYARTPNGGEWKLADPTPGEANPVFGEDIPDDEEPINYTITVSVNTSNSGTAHVGSFIGPTTGTFTQGESCTVYAVAATNYVFTNWTENGNVVSTNANYTFTVTGNRILVANFSGTTYNGHSFVDLDLPSGTLWATCNVGANSPEDYGDYYAWGETSAKAIYDWSNYKYCNGAYDKLTKYCSSSNYGNNGFTDNLTVLQASDDAATANWGNGWCIPTKAQWEELKNNTTVTWTTQNGVNGRKFTAINGRSLFLPASGYRVESIYDAGSHGNYWSSSLQTDVPSGAWVLYFYSSDYLIGGRYRGGGISVRPVRSARQN